MIRKLRFCKEGAPRQRQQFRILRLTWSRLVRIALARVLISGAGPNVSCVFAEESTQDVQDALDAIMKSEDANEMRELTEFAFAKEQLIDAEKLRIRCIILCCPVACHRPCKIWCDIAVS